MFERLVTRACRVVRNDLTKVRGTRKVLVAPRGRERRSGGPGPGEPPVTSFDGAWHACQTTPEGLYADGSGNSERPNQAKVVRITRTGADLTRRKIRVNLKSRRERRTKVRNSQSVCFLRTQQRAKSQCIIYVQNPRRGWFFGAGSTVIAMMFELMVG